MNFKYLFLSIVILFSSNLFAIDKTVDNGKGYDFGEVKPEQVSWLNDVHANLKTENILALNCKNSRKESCNLQCGDIIENPTLLVIGYDPFGTKVLTFYDNRDVFYLIQTNENCLYKNFVPMIGYGLKPHNHDH